MREERKKKTQAQRQEEDEAALERERLGGPADYDESGGTGLSAGDARESSSRPAVSEPEPGGRQEAASAGSGSEAVRRGNEDQKP